MIIVAFFADFVPIMEFLMAWLEIMMFYHALLVQQRFPHHFQLFKNL
jgi:hypothetical protein